MEIHFYKIRTLVNEKLEFAYILVFWWTETQFRIGWGIALQNKFVDRFLSLLGHSSANI